MFPGNFHQSVPDESDGIETADDSNLDNENNEPRVSWHKGHLVDLESQVEHLLRGFPGVQSAAALKWEQRLVGFITPDTISPSQLLQQLQYQFDDYLLPDFLFAVRDIPRTKDGTVDFEFLISSSIPNKPRQAERYDCFYCNRWYNTAANLAEHLRSHTGPFFFCFVPNCRARVGEIRMTRRKLYYHMDQHRRNDDLHDLPEDLKPYRAEANEYWLRTPQEVLDYIYMLLSKGGSASLLQDSNTTKPVACTVDTPSFEMIQRNWYSTLKQQACDQAEKSTARITTISNETRDYVLSYNLSRVEKGKEITVQLKIKYADLFYRAFLWT